MVYLIMAVMTVLFGVLLWVWLFCMVDPSEDQVIHAMDVFQLIRREK